MAGHLGHSPPITMFSSTLSDTTVQSPRRLSEAVLRIERCPPTRCVFES